MWWVKKGALCTLKEPASLEDWISAEGDSAIVGPVFGEVYTIVRAGVRKGILLIGLKELDAQLPPAMWHNYTCEPFRPLTQAEQDVHMFKQVKPSTVTNILERLDLIRELIDERG